MVRVTLQFPREQLSLPWGQEWYDAAKRLAADRGLGILAVSVARRVQLGDGNWYRVVFDEPATDFQLQQEG